VTLEWRSAGRPTRGAAVDFVAAGSRATEIYALGADFDPAEASTAQIVYALYLVGLVVGITPIVGVIMAYVNRAEAPEWVQTHYRLQIRTFWIGLLYGLIGGLTCMIIVGFFFLFFLYWSGGSCAASRACRQSRMALPMRSRQPGCGSGMVA
jgi:uncharacterized membrane protein